MASVAHAGDLLAFWGVAFEEALPARTSWILSLSSPRASHRPRHQEVPVPSRQLPTPEEKLADAKKLLSLPPIGRSVAPPDL